MLQFAGTGKNTSFLLVDTLNTNVLLVGTINTGFPLVDNVNTDFLLVDRRPFLLETPESDGAANDQGEKHWLHHY